MSEVSYSIIGRLDGDHGTHCNACSNIATFKVNLKNTSFRLCETCSYELFEQMDFYYRRSKRVAITALLKEAGEGLDSITSIGRKDHSNEKYDETYARAAEIRKKIQEVVG